MSVTMDVFNLFETTDYTFIKTEPVGSDIKKVTEYSANGVVKYRSGMTQSDGRESYEATTTLHIRPDEAHVSALVGSGGGIKLVGHAVRLSGEDYRISGVTTGKDFDTGLVEFYRATLEKVQLWQSVLPID